MNKLNESQKEQLSAYVDDEVGPQALSEITNPDSSLHRYQLIGDAIRGQVSDAAMVDVSASVSLAIAKEPSYSIQADSKQTKASQAQTAAPETTSWFDFSGWLKPIGGMAVAASVALVMVMVISQPDSPESDLNGASGPMATFDTQAVVSLPVSNNTNNANTFNTVIESEIDKEKLSKPEANTQTLP